MLLQPTASTWHAHGVTCLRKTTARSVFALALSLALGCGDSAPIGGGGDGGGATGGHAAGGTSGTGGNLGDPAPVDPSVPSVFRAVVFADSHVIGPQYECCSESPGIDNISIVKTEERLRSAVSRLNAIEPRPEIAFLLGDVVHDAHHENEAAWYTENRNAFTVAREVLSELEIPLHYLWGNHDYEVRCNGTSFDQSLSHELFREFFDSDPYHSVDFAGWKFLMLNGQLGASWDPEDERCSTGNASFGAEQLAWVAEQLDEGAPTVIMNHHMSALWMPSEFPDAENADMETVLGRYENDQLRFMGHTHRWLEFASKNEFVLGATRYDDDNFWLVEFDGTDGTYRILDEAKAINQGTCAETYVYDGIPVPVEDAPETGDCVVGF
ncbi:MAG: metallophosphoesterase [Myxococcota bacterium]